MKNIFSILLILLTISPDLYAANKSYNDLFQCADKQPGQIFDCKLVGGPSIQLADALTYEHRYLIGYDFTNCKSSIFDSNIAIFVGDKPAYTLKFNQKTTVSIDTKKSVFLKDTDVEDTKWSYVKEGCQLKLTILGIKPTPETNRLWREKKTTIEKNIADLNSSIAGWENAVKYHGAFSMMKVLSENFSSELTSQQMINLREHAKTYSKIIPSLMTKASATLTSEEINTLARLIIVLNEMADDQRWKKEDGSIKQIRDFLSEKDRIILEKLSTKTEHSDSEIGEFKKALTNAIRRRLELELELDEFNAFLNSQ